MKKRYYVVMVYADDKFLRISAVKESRFRAEEHIKDEFPEFQRGLDQWELGKQIIVIKVY